MGVRLFRSGNPTLEPLKMLGMDEVHIDQGNLSERKIKIPNRISPHPTGEGFGLLLWE